jgi:hypothetical protein
MDQTNSTNQKQSVSRLSVAQELKWPEEEAEFGGYVEDVVADECRHEKHLKERRAGSLGMLLVWVIFSLILAHYAAMVTLILLGHQEATDRLSGVFSGWLPVMSGLLGAVAVHYFHSRRSTR